MALFTVSILQHNGGVMTELTMNIPPSLVWLPADHRLLGSAGNTMPYLVLGDKYARALKEHAEVQPVVCGQL